MSSSTTDLEAQARLLRQAEDRVATAATTLHVEEPHYGLAETIRDKRAAILTDAYTAHPERFVRKAPQPPPLPTSSSINPPDRPEEATQ